jgi:hypothetical protein
MTETASEGQVNKQMGSSQRTLPINKLVSGYAVPNPGEPVTRPRSGIGCHDEEDTLTWFRKRFRVRKIHLTLSYQTVQKTVKCAV